MENQNTFNTWYGEKIYSKKDMDLRTKIINNLFDAHTDREGAHPQFDGMTYLQYNETNEKADNAYIPPKKNKMDKRVVTGVTRQKNNTLISLMLGMNFKPVVRVFDEDDQEMLDMGIVYTDLLKKAEELEGFDEKRYLMYRQLFAQGNVFVRERFIERFKKRKIIENSKSFSDTQWKEVYEKEYDGCESEIIDGKKVFLGNIHEPDIQKQPFIITTQHVPRELIESIYKDFDNWKYVPQTCSKTSATTIGMVNDTIFGDFAFSDIPSDAIEVIEFFDKPNNEYNIMLNGVLMLKSGFPLSHPYISPSGDYPIAKGDLNLFANFAYAKSIPADTKFAEEILNQQFRIMNIKSEQSAFVPTGNMSGKLVNESIYFPGKFTSDVSRRDLEPLIDNPGITQADFNYFQLIEGIISNQSISRALEGMQQGSTTATQYLDQIKQNFKKLGVSIDSVVNLHKRIAYLKLWNILTNWTDRVDTRMEESTKTMKNVYRKFSVEREFDGKKGMHVIEMTDETELPDYGDEEINNLVDEETSYAIKEYEAEKSKDGGVEYRISLVNPDMIKSMRYKFYIEVLPGESDSSTMRQMTLIKNITDAANIFGLESLNIEGLKKEFSKTLGIPFEQFFNPMASLEQPMQQQVTPEVQKVMEHNAMQKGAAQSMEQPAQRPQDQLIAGVQQGLTNVKK